MLVIHWIDSVIIHEYFIFIGNVIQKYETTSFVSFSCCFSLFQLYLVLLLPPIYAFLVCFYPSHYFKLFLINFSWLSGKSHILQFLNLNLIFFLFLRLLLNMHWKDCCWTPILGHRIQRADSLEKTLMLGKTEAKEEGGSRGWDG